jgi:predicted thioesterase
MDMLQTGLQGKKEMVVEREHLASVMGNIGADVLSTHCVVLLMELASRDAVDGHLPAGKITVGTQIRIRHRGAALLGSTVRAESRLEAIQGRRLVFRVEAYDEHEMIAAGENEQLIVSADRFLERIQKKKRQARL